MHTRTPETLKRYIQATNSAPPPILLRSPFFVPLRTLQKAPTVRYINDIILHCTATLPGQDVGVPEVRAWHRAQGWKDIGYHYLVRLDGSIERGRPISQPGAHCYGHNAHSIGVAYVGGLDENSQPSDTRTEAQKAALLKLLANLTLMYRCSIHGHRDYANKACPCFDAQCEYKGLYKQLVVEKR